MDEYFNELENIYKSSKDVSDIKDIKEEVIYYINKIGENCDTQKGVYTVLISLLFYKVLNPQQDIRRHQENMENGFSGRSFDTKYVTPTLKKLGLPAMAESGWLTRSLEQPFPYDKNYQGHIQKVKEEFLEILDYVEANPTKAKSMLRILFNKVIDEVKKNQVKIIPLLNPDKLSIDDIVLALNEHFSNNYGTHSGAKLPVIAFYAIYEILIKEMQRYKDCTLKDLASLTASDKTSGASGDIEVFKDGKVFESLEIKLDRKITTQVMYVVRDKIYKWNPNRYFVLSVDGIEKKDEEEIKKIIKEIQEKHGCQGIVNGLISSFNYYLRLISDPKEFIKKYSYYIGIDKELKRLHKEKWNELIKKHKL